jgi:hypothetical protein
MDYDPHIICCPIIGPILGEDPRVKELIDEDSRRWKINLIEEIFNVDEATRE